MQGNCAEKYANLSRNYQELPSSESESEFNFSLREKITNHLESFGFQNLCEN